MELKFFEDGIDVEGVPELSQGKFMRCISIHIRRNKTLVLFNDGSACKPISIMDIPCLI
jgi:hypothetical protein